MPLKGGNKTSISYNQSWFELLCSYLMILSSVTGISTWFIYFFIFEPNKHWVLQLIQKLPMLGITLLSMVLIIGLDSLSDKARRRRLGIPYDIEDGESMKKQEIICCICGQKFHTDFMDNRGCCSPACKEEYEWRKTLCIMGQDYCPKPDGEFTKQSKTQ